MQYHEYPWDVGAVKAAAVWVELHCISLSPAGFNAAVRKGNSVLVVGDSMLDQHKGGSMVVCYCSGFINIQVQAARVL